MTEIWLVGSDWHTGRPHPTPTARPSVLLPRLPVLLLEPRERNETQGFSRERAATSLHKISVASQPMKVESARLTGGQSARGGGGGEVREGSTPPRQELWHN